MAKPADAYQMIVSSLTENSTIVAIGNMGIMGAKTVDFFQSKSSTLITDYSKN